MYMENDHTENAAQSPDCCFWWKWTLENGSVYCQVQPSRRRKFLMSYWLSVSCGKNRNCLFSCSNCPYQLYGLLRLLADNKGIRFYYSLTNFKCYTWNLWPN